MNRKLLDQFQAFALPELLEDCLEEGDAQSIVFNRWGTILAAGLLDGRVILWDFETRGVAKSLHIHVAAVTSLGFSNDGRLLVATASDGSAKLWNLETNVQEGEMNLGQYILSASMNRRDARLCLVSFPSIAPSLIDFQEERSQTLPCLQLELERGGRPVSSSLHEGTTAIFNKSGELVFLTLANGCVAVLITSNLRFVDLIKVPGGSRALNLALSKNGEHLVVNYQDRVIRAFKVMEQSAGGRRHFSLPELRAHLGSMTEMPAEGSVLNPQAPLLQLASHTFQNQVDKNTWQCATFTCDSEYVAAASASKDTHQIHIWTRWGRLERILEGPNNGVRDVVWHPTRSLMASVATNGAIYLWARVQAENWSAFAPDFTELQENEEYVEPEDVFDVNPKANSNTAEGAVEDGTAPMDVEEGDIDILTVEQVDAESSDTEADRNRFDHIPVEIIAQNFDEKGQLVLETVEQVKQSESPALSSPQDSDPAISDGGDSRPNSGAPAVGKHRLSATSLPDDEQGSRLRPGRQKRYLDDFDEELLEEDSSDARRFHTDF